LPEDYAFTADWFSWNLADWTKILSGVSVTRALEIGSYEGRSATWLIENVLAKDGSQLVAVDAWGAQEVTAETRRVEEAFDRNIAIARKRFPGVRVEKCKGASAWVLPLLLARGEGGSYDFVYVDANHGAADVLSDLVMAFHLCKPGGLIFCDDYLWFQQRDPLETPKIAIDAFTTCFHYKVEIIPECRLYQIYLRKISD
jgi:predicted O-methyltransferase YrrM